MTINEKVAYLKGLAEGLGLDTENSKEAKLLSVMIGILEEVGLSLEDLEENALALGEELDALSEDLGELESIFSDDLDECGCGCGHDHDDEDIFPEFLDCPNCEEQIYLDAASIAKGSVNCAHCDAQFQLHIQDEDTDDDIED